MTKLLWADLETPGLDPRTPILEIAWGVTEVDLTEVVPFKSTLVFPSLATQSALENMDQFVREMHEKSGLLDELEMVQHGHGQALPIQEVQKAIITDLQPYMGEVIMLAGQSPQGVDHPFIKNWMPLLDSHYLAHRHYDVRTLRTFFDANGFPIPDLFGEVPTHRALDDVTSSLREAKFYQETTQKYMRVAGRVYDHVQALKNEGLIK